MKNKVNLCDLIIYLHPRENFIACMLRMWWNPLRQYWKRTNLYYIICIIAVFYPECLLHIGNPFSLFLYFPIDPKVRKSYSLRNATLSDAFTYLSCFPTGMREAMFLIGETRERSGCHGEANLKVSHCRPCLPMGYMFFTHSAAANLVGNPCLAEAGHSLTLYCSWMCVCASDPILLTGRSRWLDF